MPNVEVVFFREDEETVPMRDWLDTIPPKAQAKCLAKLERLQELGRTVTIVSHGCTKERKVPKREIDLAVERKLRFEKDREAHSE